MTSTITFEVNVSCTVFHDYVTHPRSHHNTFQLPHVNKVKILVRKLAKEQSAWPLLSSTSDTLPFVREDPLSPESVTW